MRTSLHPAKLYLVPVVLLLVVDCHPPAHNGDAAPPSRRATAAHIAEHGSPIPGQPMIIRGDGLVGDGWTALVRLSWGSARQRRVEFLRASSAGDNAISVVVPVDAHGHGTLAALGNHGESATLPITYARLARPIIRHVDVAPLRTRVLADGISRGQQVEMRWEERVLWRGQAVADGVVHAPSTWHQAGEFNVVLAVEGVQSPAYRVTVGDG